MCTIIIPFARIRFDFFILILKLNIKSKKINNKERIFKKLRNREDFSGIQVGPFILPGPFS